MAVLLPEQARAVVVGAGIAGCSVAYHLTALGWRDVVVVDQGPLYETGGSTTHAPGLVFQLNSSKMMTDFARYTVGLWGGLEVDGARCVNNVGSLEAAWTPERLADLHRKAGLGRSWGVEAHVIGPDEARGMIPMLSDRVLGALYVPSDVHVRATLPAEAMARAAEGRGAAFFGGVKVTGFDVADGRVRAVRTSAGDIRTDVVVAAAGIWAPALGRMAGAHIPLSPMQHLYAVTVPLAGLAGETAEVRQPLLRHQDAAMYFRQVGDAYGIGSYNHEPLVMDAEQILAPEDAPVMPSVVDFTPRHFEPALAAAREILPGIELGGLTEKFNGIFSFTMDGFPVLGESPDVRGFWSAQAVWITHAGGVGKAVAEWIVGGEPEVDVREGDIRRFHRHALGRGYVRERAAQQYREVYDIIHPRQQPASPRNLRLSPFYARQVELDAVFFESSGWERPQWYGANEGLLDSLSPAGTERSGWAAREWSPIVAAEHAAARERVAMFDLTPFAKFEIAGPGALGALQRLATNQMDRPVGSVTYTSMLTPSGGIKCDLTVTRLGSERFMVVTGGGMGLHDLAWIEGHLPADGSARVADVSGSLCCVGLWGPRARDLLARVCEDDVGDAGLPYLRAREIDVGGVPALALRISYVGELGWEIYAPTEMGLRLWDLLWDAGQGLGVVAAGGGAFDSLRLEKGYRLWGNDIHTEYNPYEAGIGFAVRMRKGDFVGRDALRRVRAEGVRRRLCCMTLDDASAVVVGKEPILDGDTTLGYVTSANYGHSVGRGIVYGYLPVEYAVEGRKVDVLYFGERVGATVASEPLYDSAGVKMR